MGFRVLGIGFCLEHYSVVPNRKSLLRRKTSCCRKATCGSRLSFSRGFLGVELQCARWTGDDVDTSAGDARHGAEAYRQQLLTILSGGVSRLRLRVFDSKPGVHNRAFGE